MRNGVNGFRFNPALLDESEMVAAIVASLSDLECNPERASAMGKRSLQIIREEHNIDSYVAGIKRAVDCATEQS